MLTYLIITLAMVIIMKIMNLHDYSGILMAF